MPDVGQSATASQLDMALLPGDAANATFPRFRELPAEIQIAIWDAAAASPVLTPEYAPIHDLVEGYVKGASRDDDPTPILLDLMVLTSWSPLMHTCFESRAAALRSSSLPLRFSDMAGFQVPCRRFDTAIDALFFPFIDELSGHWEGYEAHPLFETLTTQTKCLIPFHQAETLNPPRPSPEWYGSYGYTELRDASGCVPDIWEEFNPRAPIRFRTRMRLVRITKPHKSCQVVLPSFEFRYKSMR